MTLKNNVIAFFIGIFPVSLAFWYFTIKPVYDEFKLIPKEEIMKESQSLMKIVEDNRVLIMVTFVLLVVAYTLVSVLVGYICLNIFKQIKKLVTKQIN